MAKRRYGGGSVTSYTYTAKAKNGRGTRKVTKWRWQLRVPLDQETPDGPTRLVGKGGYSNAADAQEGLEQARAAQKEGKSPTLHTGTVGAFAGQWLDGLTLAPATVAGYRKIVRNQIAPHLGDKRLDTLTPAALTALYGTLRKNGGNGSRHSGEGLSPNTISKVHNVLAAILDAAVIAGYISTNPARHPTVTPPRAREIRASQDEIHVWTAAQLRAFLAWDRDDYRDPMHTLWATIAGTGLRRSEAIALRWSDFDATGQRLAVRRAADTANARTVKSTKSGSARVVDLSSDLTQLLAQWRSLRADISPTFATGSAFIFGNDNGELRSPNEVGRRWRTRVQKAQGDLPDLPILTLHGLRHTHATLLLLAGVQPKVVQERLGHSTIAVTMNTYSHVMPSMQRDAVSRLDTLMGQ